MSLQRSAIPTYKKMFENMNNMENVFVNSYREGIEKVRQSDGKYAFILESVMNDYHNNREPCDTFRFGKNLNKVEYGIAFPIGSPLK